MLSKKNLSEQERQITGNPNRFTLRKLNIGVCSVIAGLSFMGINAHADQVQADQQPAQPTGEDQATSSATSQLQATKQVALLSTDTSTKANTTNTTNQPQTSAVQGHQQTSPAVVLAADNQAVEQDQVNVSAWKYERQSDGILLNGYNGTAQNGQYIVPNSYDFTKAGIIQAGQNVYIEKTLPRQLNGTQFIISHNGNGKVIAKGTDWSSTFGSSSYQLVDLGNLDVSHVANMSYMFSYDAFTSAWSLQTVKGLANWDTRSLTNMKGIFNMDQALTSVDSMANWDVSHVTDMSESFAGCEQLKIHLDLSHWNTSNVTNTEGMFCNTQLAGINISGWDLSHDTNVNEMFGYGKTLGIGYIWAPAFVNMMGVKMPTQTHFDIDSFGTNRIGSESKQLIVYSDDPTILALNSQNNPVNQITIKTADGKLNKTIKLDNFVFNGPDALIAALQTMTTKTKVDDMVAAAEAGSGKTVAESNFDSNGSLKHDYQPAANDPVSLVMGPGSIYTVALQGPAYTQQIIYVDGNNHQVGETSLTGHLDGNDNKATISAATLNNQIAQKMPSGYYLTSNPLTADVNISSTNPTPVKVQVSNQAQLTITYQTADGHQVGQPVVKNGTVGQVVDITAPENYALVNNNDTYYTLLPQAQQAITVLVQHLTGTITVEYVDTDDNNHIVKDQHFTGNVGEPANLTYQVPDGYDLVGQLPSTTYTYTKDGQTITIELQHKAASLEIQYIDGQNNVISHQTVNGRVGVQTELSFTLPTGYVADGQLPAAEYTFTDQAGQKLTIHIKKAQETVKVVYQDENGQTVTEKTVSGNYGDEVRLPAVPAGYELADNQPTTYKLTDQPNQQVTVKVNHAQETAKVIFQDENGHQVGQAQTISGKYGHTVELPAVPAGYKLAPNQPTTYTLTADANQQVVLHVNRAAETVKIVYYENGQQVGQAKQISCHYGDVLKLTFQEADENTSALMAMLAVQQAIPVTLILPAGYELADSNQATIDYHVTNTEEKIMPIEVKKIAASVKVIYQTADGQQVKSETVDGQVGDSTTLNFTAPAGYQLAEGQVASQHFIFNRTNDPIVVKVETTSMTPDHDDHEQPVTPTDNNQHGQKPSTAVPAGQNNGNGSMASQLTNGQTAVPVHATTNKQAEQLPQTGDHRAAGLAALGGVALMLALGLTGKVRHHE